MSVTRGIIGSLTAVAALASCAAQPMTRERAARLCADEARAADGITGNLRIGTSSAGPTAGGRFTLNSNILDPRPEAEALEACIIRRLEGRPTPRQPGFSISIEGDL